MKFKNVKCESYLNFYSFSVNSKELLCCILDDDFRHYVNITPFLTQVDSDLAEFLLENTKSKVEFGDRVFISQEEFLRVILWIDDKNYNFYSSFISYVNLYLVIQSIKQHNKKLKTICKKNRSVSPSVIA